MPKTCTRAELIRNLNTLGYTQSEATVILEAMLNEITVALEQGEQVKISGFGNFSIRDKRERPGRNPNTGASAVITARRVASFRAGRRLRKYLDTRVS